MSVSLRVLFVEDPENRSEPLWDELRRGGYVPEVERVTTPDAMSRALWSERPDVVIAEMAKSPFRASEALEVLRETGSHIPFIVISGASGNPAAAALVQAGADYCVSRDDLPRLVPILKRCLPDVNVHRRGRQTGKIPQAPNGEKPSTVDLLPEVVFACDRRLRILWANRAACNLMKKESREVIGRYCFEMIEHSRQPCAACPVLKSFETGCTEESQKVTRDGRTLVLHSRPSRDEDGNISGAIAWASDATGREWGEEALQARSAFIQTLIDIIPDPIFYKALDGTYLGCNKAFEECIGLAGDDIIGKTAREIAPEECASQLEAADGELLTKPGIQTCESLVRYADGTVHDIIFKEATFSNIDGSPAGVVGVMIDISDIRKANRALRDREQQLLHIQKMEPIGRLASGVAHDFNNLLTAIMGHTEILLQGLQSNQPACRSLEEIRRACGRAAALP